MKTTKIALFMAALMFAPSAFAYEITPYVGLGIVVDKASTSAKRLGFDKTKNQINLPMLEMMSGSVNIGELVGGTIGDGIVVNGGGDMAFDAAFAGEITAGVRIDNVRLEFEAAFRSASEDSYNLYDGNFDVSGTMQPMPNPIPLGAIAAAIETSTSVRHDSYLFNMFYDFNFGTRWTPYVGAGIGFGRYQQETSFNYNADLTDLKTKLEGIAGAFGDQQEAIKAIVENMPNSVTGSVTPDQASHDLYRFEWQVSAGVAYNFDEDWVLDLGYRFNSATVGGEFVYAHEVKLGARYMF